MGEILHKRWGLSKKSKQNVICHIFGRKFVKSVVCCGQAYLFVFYQKINNFGFIV